MQTLRAYLCASACSLVAAASQAADAPARLLALTNSKPGSFEVISHRMDPVATGAIIGGLVGAAIESGVHSSQDDSLKKRLLETYPEASCDRPLIEAFSTRIRASGQYEVDNADKTAVAVDIEISECGLHLADSTAKEFAAYVYLKLKVKPASGTAWNESIQVSGRNRYDLETFFNQQGLAQAEMEDTLKRAGTRAADKIIYKK